MSKSESTCDICGRPIFGKPITKYIEGAKLLVCPNCSRFGKPVKTPKTTSVKPKITKRRKRSYSGIKKQTDFILIENFGTVIRKARENKKWTQDELARKLKEPLSLIKRIEKNKINPSFKIVKKIEGLLNISLREVDIGEVLPKFRPKPKPGTTIGDIVEIKKKK
ncbi:MAG: multiprotein bridging factor aMBF1 [Candidatus Helarchaeota archaeon]